MRIMEAMKASDRNVPQRLIDDINEVGSLEATKIMTAAATTVPGSSDNPSGELLFEAKARTGLRIVVTPEKIITTARGRNSDIPVEKVSNIVIQRSALDVLRSEKTVVMNLECGRVVTIRRVPDSTAKRMVDAILSAV